MRDGMNIAFLGSSLLSAYWNGAATYYRGIIRGLNELGHHVRFYEPDAYDRQHHRDITPPNWAEVIIYDGTSLQEAEWVVEDAATADVVIKASGVGCFDQFLEKRVAELGDTGQAMAVYWDVDAPATLERLARSEGNDPLAWQIPRYDLVLTYGGGPPVVHDYERWGARQCLPIYNGLDATTHYPAAPTERFSGALGFLGNRLPDRESRVDSFFLEAARYLPQERFVMGGGGWEDKPIPPNVRYIGHVASTLHNQFNATPRAVLNICRQSMARVGYSPPTRIFEAAGAGACIISDAWEGIETFFIPGEEILIARDGREVAELIRRLAPDKARRIGEAARQRALAEHRYDQRARQVAASLAGASAAP